jgi:hypothetical protein
LKDTAGEFKKEKHAFFEIISLLKIIAERAFYREADPSISGNSRLDFSSGNSPAVS